jgi:hypothetical protein
MRQDVQMERITLAFKDGSKLGPQIVHSYQFYGGHVKIFDADGNVVAEHPEVVSVANAKSGDEAVR